MSEINAYSLQQQLKKLEYVSVPWLQVEFDLQYADAKELLRLIMARGWVSEEADGNRYQVIKENLKLRAIRRSEVDVLCEEITANCVTALQYIQKKCDGALLSEIASALKDDDDATEAVAVLTKNNLIYSAGTMYFNCVSSRTVSVLAEVARAKRYSNMRRRSLEDSDDTEKLRRLFDKLFDS